MPDIEIKGKTFRGVVRCSTPGQIEESIPSQQLAVEAWAKTEKVAIDDWFELPGLSATQSRQMEPLLKLIRSRCDGAAVDGLVLDNFSRFCRTEADSARLYAECIDANLLLATCKEGVLMGDGKWIARGLATDQAMSYAKDLARNVNKKVGQLMEDGSITPTCRYVYGLDREHYDAQRTTMFRVTKHPDGRFEVRDGKPPHVHLHWLPVGAKKVALRGKKESFAFVPGTDDRTATVLWLMWQYWVERRTSYSIAMELNAKGIPAPAGGIWYGLCVSRMAESPLYLGFSVGSIEGSGVHLTRSKGLPTQRVMPRRAAKRLDGKGVRKTITPHSRPPSEWFIQEQPKLMSFLPPEVREPAMVEWNRKLREGWHNPKRKRTSPWTPDSQSKHFLSRIMRLANGGTMVGISIPQGRGEKKKTHRYYLSNHLQNAPIVGKSTYRIRADYVEAEVVRAISQLVEFPTDVEDQIADYVRDRQRELVDASHDLHCLQAEKNQLENWYRSVFSAASARGQEILGDEAQRVESRLDSIEKLMGEVANADLLSMDSAAVVRAVGAQLKSLKDVNSSLPMRGLAEFFIADLVYDPAANRIDLVLGLPDSVMTEPEKIREQISNPQGSGSRGSARAKFKNPVFLSKTRCDVERKGRTSCLTCYRVPLELPDVTAIAA